MIRKILGRTMRKLFSAITLGFLVLLESTLPPTTSSLDSALAQEGKGNIDFKWGFGAIVGKGKTQKFVLITRDTVLRTGDELKMVLEPRSSCFLYLIYQGSTGELSLLFPYNFRQFETDYVKGKQYYIPRGGAWFKLETPTGTERFFVVASVHRLQELESLFQKYHNANESSRAEISNEILTEIRDLKKRYKTFATLAERPISIGGNVRGDVRPDVADFTTEISADNFYSKTFTIDHQK